MNAELVKQEIENILSEVKQPIRKQYPISKTQERELKELGLFDLMPRQYGEIGYTNAAKVLEVANQGDTATFNQSSEGSEIAASKLFQLLNEVEEIEEAPDEPQLTQEQRNELALLYVELERDERDYQKALAKYGNSYMVAQDLRQSIIMRKDAIAKIYESLK